MQDNNNNNSSNNTSNKKINEKEEHYQETIKNNPQLLFSNISSGLINVWKSKLSSKSEFTKFKDDTQILMKIPNHSLQDLIKNDCERTRKRESILIPGYKKILESLLTYYCEKKKINYKQSINEIFGIFLLLKYKIPELKFIDIYNISESFIDIYLTNYYLEPIDYNKETKELITNTIDKYLIDKFFPVYSSLTLFNLLLKYHEPGIYNILDKYNVDPKLYGMKWFMTAFLSILKVDIAYNFLDYLIQISDSSFLFYFFLAIIKVNRKKILENERIIYIEILSKLNIDSIVELTDIMSIAMELRKDTPYSFQILINKLLIFQKNITTEDLYKKYIQFSPDNMPTIPTFPMEILYICYKEQIQCPDQNCIKNKKIDNKKKKDKNNQNPKINNQIYICERCNLKINKNNMKHILIDMRIYNNMDSNEEKEKIGFLPNSIMFTLEELQSEDFPKILSERFKPNRGFLHFIFLTSETQFSNLEKGFYEEKEEDDDLIRQLKIFGQGGIEEKTEKKLNLKKVENNLNNNDILKLKEYDNFKLTLNSFLNENYPYVSYSYGGYNLIHDYSIYYDISLIEHEEQKCFLCKKKKNKNNQKENKKNENENEIIKKLWEHKKKIKYDYINEISKVNDNFINFCTLNEMNGKKISEPIIFCLLFHEYKIEIYKIEKKKIYDDTNLNDNIIPKKYFAMYYDIGNNINNNKKEEPQLTLIQTLNYSLIIKLTRNKDKKNILIIEHLNPENKKEKSSTILEFATKDEPKNFIKIFKKMSEKYELMNNNK